MERDYSIYEDIATRTNGEIYIGVVGPVRTGKSTFIKRFMEGLVIPNIQNPYERERAIDETPQSGSGRTIMTTEPKFVPNEAVIIEMEDNATMNVRLVDCVGYMVKSALGYMEGEMPRMVHTPWFEDPIPFEDAAETGTRKVIREHSSIAIAMTSDGSFTNVPREEYEEAEEKVIAELEESQKPYIIILNSAFPEQFEVRQMAEKLTEKYRKPVIPMDCLNMTIRDIHYAMKTILYEFPVREVAVDIPRWITRLEPQHWLRNDIICALREAMVDKASIRHINDNICMLNEYDFVKSSRISEMQLGCGRINLEVNMSDGLFYQILNAETGLNIDGEHELFGVLKELSGIKNEYKKIEYALHEVKTKGYGVVTPQLDELTLESPEIIRQGNRFGVRLRASAPSIHMIRADIETEIAPLVGSEKQSEELVTYLLKEFEDQPDKLWDSNIFGKSLYELITEGLQNKLYKMPEDAQMKLQETLQRIINEGSGGLICIIL
ncbi:MAG TPA: stage IV sporulation protein A [Thermoclostridium sp.]|nr:stage IV sporulation protein A [Thermoclostridium sp.]